MDDRPMPWVRSAAERREREQEAGRLVGQRLVAVRYFEIDYRRLREHGDEILHGPRDVTDAEEWADPEWRLEAFDSIDFGLELDTAGGTTFGAVWEQFGDDDGLALRAVPLRPVRLAADRELAVWDVGARSRWAPFLGREVTAVDLRWTTDVEPQADGTATCRDIGLHFGSATLHLTLGEADPVTGLLGGAVDNVAVVDDALARRLGLGGHRRAER